MSNRTRRRLVVSIVVVSLVLTGIFLDFALRTRAEPDSAVAPQISAAERQEWDLGLSPTIAAIEITPFDEPRAEGWMLRVVDPASVPVKGAAVFSHDGRLGVSDDDGAFLVPPSIRTERVSLLHPEFVPKTITLPSEKGQVLVQLATGPSITGHAVNVDGTPLEGVRVEVSNHAAGCGLVCDPNDPTVLDVNRTVYRKEGITDASGRFRIGSLAPGNHWVTARKPGWALLARGTLIPVLPGESELELEFCELYVAAVAVRLTDAEGVPLESDMFGSMFYPAPGLGVSEGDVAGATERRVLREIQDHLGTNYHVRLAVLGRLSTDLEPPSAGLMKLMMMMTKHRNDRDVEIEWTPLLSFSPKKVTLTEASVEWAQSQLCDVVVEGLRHEACLRLSEAVDEWSQFRLYPLSEVGELKRFVRVPPGRYDLLLASLGSRGYQVHRANIDVRRSAGETIVRLDPEKDPYASLSWEVLAPGGKPTDAYRLAYRRDGGEVTYLSGPKLGVAPTILVERGEYEFWAFGLRHDSPTTSVTRLSVSGSGRAEKLSLSF